MKILKPEITDKEICKMNWLRQQQKRIIWKFKVPNLQIIDLLKIK